MSRVSPVWPEDWAALPCAVVSEASNRPVARYDGKERLTEVSYYVRVFAERAAELAEISSAVDDAMLALGYLRQMAHEDDSAAIRQRVLRYRMYRQAGE